MNVFKLFGINLNGTTETAGATRTSAPVAQPPYSEKGWQEKMAQVENGFVSPYFAHHETPVQLDLSELETQRDKLASDKSAAEGDLSSINSGESEELAGLKAEMDKAYEEYQNSMSDDAESNPEMAALKEEEDAIKTETEENATNILNKETEISSKSNEISEQTVLNAGFESELETLRSQLSSIPANSTEEGSEENNARLDAQRAEIQRLIILKSEQLKQGQSKLERLEEEKKSLEMELIELKNKKTELETREKEVQTKIQETASENTKKAQEAYNAAKQEFETQRANLSQSKQEEIANIQSQINEVDAQISQAKEKQYEEGNYEVNGRDVTDLATQYEGLTNNEMREIFEAAGARFDDGQWCADFVKFMMDQTYGPDNTPGDFSNTCLLFCSCSEMKRWAEERGRATTDQSALQAGDAIIVNTKSGGLHVGIVVSVNEDGTLNTIEGNTLDDHGNYDDSNPGQVNRRKRTPEEVNTYILLH